MLKNKMCVYFHSCNNNDVRFIFIHATCPSNVHVHCTLEKEKYFKIRLAHWRTFVYSILYVHHVCVCVYGRYVCHMYECGTSRVGCMHAHVKVIQSSLESDLRFVCTILLSTPDLSHALLSFVCSPLCYASLFLCIRMEKKMCNLSNDTIFLNPRRNQQQRII